MDAGYLIGAVAVMAVATFLTRAAPFWLLRGQAERAWLRYLGRYLPAAVLTVLVFYCLRGVAPVAPRYGLPEAAGVLATVALHRWRRQALLSIGGGTAVHVALLHWLGGA